MNDKEKRKYLIKNYGIYVKTVTLGAIKYLIAYHYVLNRKRNLAKPRLSFNHLFFSMEEIIEAVEEND